MKLRAALMMSLLWMAHASFLLGALPGNNRGTCVSESLDRDIAPGFGAVRVVEDHSSHRQWLVERNLERPGWPGRVVPLRQQLLCGDEASLRRNSTGKRMAGGASDMVIRAGEALIIVEDTKAAHAELTAIAVSNGRRGDEISARLRSSGKLVKAIAAGPGRAALADASSERYR